jgi:hypothetical protein
MELISKVSITITPFFGLSRIRNNKSLGGTRLGSKSAHVGLTMTMSTHVQMPSLVSTMSIRWWEELNVFEGSACSCFLITWKLTFRAIVAKVSWITSWVFVHSLPWTQHKKWIPIRSMGCVHTHQRILVIEGWGNLICIQSVVEKIKEASQNPGKISRIVS